ncbi:SET and MYND domain-containing protein 4-like [Aphidius gifuensis]|uniref:SET and MYND domain-containing protein 4-like n=1 Tax=Aphidius gifuensis TaxID=684658 RepID=UPI001CDC0056|nr:SET and MYND domain-containing protein 4-like [Aphidius gifuensis]
MFFVDSSSVDVEMIIAKRQFSEKTTFKDKFEVAWNFIAPYIKKCPNEVVKTASHSKLWREIGNTEYTNTKNKDYLRKSIMEYTKSINLAPVGSIELSLAYANRSAVLFKARLYEDCLLDIERSLKAGYPDRLKTKLFLRQLLCFKALKPNSGLEPGISMANAIQWLPELKKYHPKYNIIKEYPKMINELKEPREIIKFIPEIKNDNAIIVGASDAIELKKINENNQYIVATRDIKSGEFIYICESFAAIPSNQLRFTNCWHCCHQTWAGIPCDNCPNVIYCSERCKKKAWNSYHNIECLVFGQLLKVDNVDQGKLIAVKMILKSLNSVGGLIQLKKKIDDIDLMKNKELIFTNGILDVNTIDNFLRLDYFKATSSKCTFECALLAVLIVTVFGENTDILGKKMTLNDLIKSKDKKILILGELILRYMMIASCISQSLIESSAGCSLMLTTDSIPFCNTKILKTSCDPNVNWSHVGSDVGFYTCKPIKQGQPILMGSVDSYHMTSKIDRYRRLEFTTDDAQLCGCTACVENWTTIHSLPSYESMSAIPTRIQRELDFDFEMEREFVCGLINIPSEEGWINIINKFLEKKTFEDRFEVVWSFLPGSALSKRNTNNFIKDKSVVDSIHWRTIGNNEYTATSKNKDYISKSIEAYTKSIAYAPVGSSELSLAYANRSAVLFKAGLYNDCLLDIERSLKIGYPDNLKTKLHIRQSLCFKALKPSS